jgi:hypothetical protein
MSRKPPIETFPERISIGDKYAPAMEITDQAEADMYFEKCVAHSMRFNMTREKAEELERINLGYYAGYYNSETRARVEKLFNCAHPVFGAIAEKGQPTPEAAYAKGVEMGAEILHEKLAASQRKVAVLDRIVRERAKGANS